ncbi:hypothetical protein C8J56DRAFT_767959, partial [Mycena floridula]
LDALLYQAHAIAFLYSPSLWILCLRLFVTQPQCRQPRELNNNRTLRFCMVLVTISNLCIVWSHAIHGATEGNGIILDFVGLSFTPSKFQLLRMDLSILFLQLILTVLAYEISPAENKPCVHETSSPSPTSLRLCLPYARMKPKSPLVTSEYVLDLQFHTIAARRNVSVSVSHTQLLPLSNMKPSLEFDKEQTDF